MDNKNIDFIHAVKNGDYETVNALLDSGVDIDISESQSSNTALIWAALKGYIEIVNLLIERKADVNNVDEHGYTALMWACYNGRADIVLALVAANADIDMADEDGSTALMIASCYGRTNIAELLIEKGANRNIKDNNGYTAIIHASKSGASKIVYLLINKGKDEDKNKDKLAILAEPGEVYKNNSIYSKSKEKISMALIVAAEQNHRNIVELLLYELDKAYGESLCYRLAGQGLLKACENGHYDVAKLLIDNKANLDVHSNDRKKGYISPLYSAIKANESDIIDLLIESGARVVDDFDDLAEFEKKDMKKRSLNKFKRLNVNSVIIYDSNGLMNHHFILDRMFELNHVRHLIPHEVLDEIDNKKSPGKEGSDKAMAVNEILPNHKYNGTYGWEQMTEVDKRSNADNAIVDVITKFCCSEEAKKFTRIYVCTGDKNMNSKLNLPKEYNLTILI